MDYEKMKALMGKAQVKEFPKPDSEPDWKYLDSVREEQIAA